jgi:hypothetical protein
MTSLITVILIFIVLILILEITRRAMPHGAPVLAGIATVLTATTGLVLALLGLLK